MSLSLMAVPVLLDTTTSAPELFHQWARMYHYGHQILPGMAIGTFFLYALVSIRKCRANEPKPWRLFALAGCVTLSIIPFILLVMKPVNDELFRLEAMTRIVHMGIQSEASIKGIKGAKELVVKWSWMHFTRSWFPLVGAVIGALGMIRNENSSAKKKEN